MAYYDVGTRSSAASSLQPGDMAAAAVPVATGSPHQRVLLEAGAAGSSAALGKPWRFKKVLLFFFLCLFVSNPIHENMHVYTNNSFTVLWYN
jgi:hypothetical protein